MATTVPRTTLAILLVFVGLLAVGGGAFSLLPVCAAADPSCATGSLTYTLESLFVGVSLIAAGVAITLRY